LRRNGREDRAPAVAVLTCMTGRRLVGQPGPQRAARAWHRRQPNSGHRACRHKGYCRRRRRGEPSAKSTGRRPAELICTPSQKLIPLLIPLLSREQRKFALIFLQKFRCYADKFRCSSLRGIRAASIWFGLMLLARFAGSKGPFEIPLLAAEFSGLRRRRTSTRSTIASGIVAPFSLIGIPQSVNSASARSDGSARPPADPPTGPGE